MKDTVLNILCGVAVAAMIAAAICIGAVGGWRGEREDALADLAAELSAVLEERAMDAANLSVVAARHLPARDEALTRLQALRAALTDPDAGADALIEADRELTALARELGRTLPELASVQASARDQAYVSALTRALSENTGLTNAYELLARGFNDRLNRSPTGWIARLFGVAPIAVPSPVPAP